ncbi:MAG: MarR family transcriptional regulator [Capsulimonas sp.]|uniref:MarR family winged helix-turn-helix transcriptional regulator n=1 Tax=Capsulimonas sp. TaxID=2494211 RepID=UPI003263D20D
MAPQGLVQLPEDPKEYFGIQLQRPPRGGIENEHVSYHIDSVLSIWYASVMDYEQGINDPASRFALAVFRVNGVLMNAGEKLTKPLAQSSARWQILGRAGYTPQTVSQMAREMGLARQSVQRVADALQRDGLVVLEAIPTDKRTALLTLTPAGQEVLAKIYKRNAEWTRRISGRISAHEFEKAIESLEHIRIIIEEDLHE